MTIDEAIVHAEWAANNCEGECSEEHKQLAEWLKELRERRCADVALEDERNILSERLGDYREFLRGARVKSDKLRELVEVLINCGRKYHTMNGSCPMFDADAADDDFCGAVQAARDLGIEVE